MKPPTGVVNPKEEVNGSDLSLLTVKAPQHADKTRGEHERPKYWLGPCIQ